MNQMVCLYITTWLCPRIGSKELAGTQTLGSDIYAGKGERAVTEFFRLWLEAGKAGNREKGISWGQRNGLSMGSPSKRRDARGPCRDKRSHKRAPGPTQVPTQGSRAG